MMRVLHSRVALTKAKVTTILAAVALMAVVSVAPAGSASAQSPSQSQSLLRDAVGDLREGGYVLAMRHAHSPRQAPEAASAHPENVELERQLDEQGRADAVAMGQAMRKLGIPIGEILSSPTVRALQTVQALGLGDARAVEELGDGGRNMQPDSEGQRSAWLRATAAESPRESTNVLLVTHLPNLRGAFGDEAAGMADGETLILRSTGGGVSVVGRVRIDEWISLAAE